MSTVFHLLALLGTGLFSWVVVGNVGVMTLMFWAAGFVYAVLIWCANAGSRVAYWLALIPPAVWLHYSSKGLVPQLAHHNPLRESWLLFDLITVPIPCLAAIIASIAAAMKTSKPGESAQKQPRL